MRRDCIPEALSRAFSAYGRIVATCPLPFLLTPIIGTLALASGFLFINPTSDLEYLYVPINAPGKAERRDVEDTFLYDHEEYYTGSRRTRIGGMLRVLVKDKNGGDVFTDSHVQQVRALDEYVTQHVNVEYDGEHLHYDDVCARWLGACADSENSFLSYMTNQSLTNIPITYPIHSTPQGPLILSFQIGKPNTNSQNIITSAKAFLLQYPVRFDKHSARIQARSTAWTRKLVTKILAYEAPDIDVNVDTFESIEQELETAIYEVVPLFTFTFMILGSFAFLSLLMSDWVRGKPYIASAGMIAAMLAACSGMGFLLLCGVKFTTAIGAVPFLIIGIGMDDMYILVSAWRNTGCAQPVGDRLGLTLQHSAVSITITSITDALAFGIGCITPFRSVQLFCGYTMLGVVFCYFYQLTFTVAAMVYDGRREERNRHCITFHPVISRKQAAQRPVLYQWLCTGGPEKAEHIEPEDECHRVPPNDIKLPRVNRFMGNQFAVFLMKTPVKIAVMIAYGLYLGFGVYGITQMKEGLERSNLVPDTSYYVTFYNDYLEYFGLKYGPNIMLVYDEPLNYSDPDVRHEIQYNLDTFTRNKYFFSNQYATVSWLDNYEQYLEQTGRDINDLSETEFLTTLRLEFLTIPAFKSHICDVTFNPSNTSIVASRMFVQSHGPRDAVGEREIMVTSREIAAASKFKAYTYNIAFTYFDQYTIILSTTMQNLAIATASMLVVALIFIPSVTTVIWVTLTTVSIEVGVLGYMVFWNVNLDSISMINLIMCIGFSVDFAAHISYHYTISPRQDPVACAKDALGHLGTPILQSAVSTILGVAILAVSVSYIFRTFFKIVTMVMLFGSFHGLFVLPVILSTIKACSGSRDMSRDSERRASSRHEEQETRLHNGHSVQCQGTEDGYSVEIFVK